MNLKGIRKDDRIEEFPETYNADIKEIEKAINSIMYEIYQMRNDIEHLKIMIRGD